jgi:hypothetical protein
MEVTMKALLTTLMLVLLLALPASQALCECYGWENCGTILGKYGNLVGPGAVGGPQIGSMGSTLPWYVCPGPAEGSVYLHVAEDPHSSTPQAYIAYVENLVEGDTVYASFYGFDITPGMSPSLRIWGHYANNGDVTSYAGSAGGNSAYTAGTGWDLVEHTWIIPADKEALVVEARLYSTPSTNNPDHTDFFIDDLHMEWPSTATVTFPAPGPTPVEDTTWGRLKSLFR